MPRELWIEAALNKRARIAPRKIDGVPSQRVPARPRHPSSTLVEIGFLSFHNPNASLSSTFSMRLLRTSLRMHLQSNDDDYSRTADKDSKRHKTS